MTKYLKLVKTLAKTGESIKDSLTPAECMALHAVLGIVSENYELKTATDKLNLLEEAGDMFFFGCMLGLALEIPVDLEKSPPRMAPAEYADRSAGEITDMVKAAIIYRKPLDKVALQELIWDLFGAVRTTLVANGYTVQNALDHNREKLAKRYPNAKFSEAAGRERVDKGATT